MRLECTTLYLDVDASSQLLMPCAPPAGLAQGDFQKMLRIFRKGHPTLVASSSLLALLSAPAFAQVGPIQADLAPSDEAAASGNDGEILVTARRREERAQDVPIALTAVSGDTLERTGAINITQIAQLTPTLVIRNNNARNTFANIRGLGSNSDQNDGLEIGVGFYIDDVYY